MTAEALSEYMTTTEAAQLTGVSIKTIWQWVERGEVRVLPRVRPHPYQLERAGVLVLAERYHRPRDAEPGYLTIRQAAELVGISPNTMAERVKSGYMRVAEKRLGRATLLHADSVVAYVERLRSDADAARVRTAELARREVRIARGLRPGELDRIKHCVCDELGVPLVALDGRGREPDIIEARRTLIWYLGRVRKFGATKVGHLVGRDHATVAHHLGIADALLAGKVGTPDMQEQFRWCVGTVRARLKAEQEQAATLTPHKSTAILLAEPGAAPAKTRRVARGG